MQEVEKQSFGITKIKWCLTDFYGLLWLRNIPKDKEMTVKSYVNCQDISVSWTVQNSQYQVYFLAYVWLSLINWWYPELYYLY